MGFYEAIDDWTDIPVVYYRTLSPYLEVTIWEDGRIAWQTQLNDEYFKSRIPKDKMTFFLEKMTSGYNDSPLKRALNKYHDLCQVMDTAHVLHTGYATIHTPQICSDEMWQSGFLNKAGSLDKQLEKEAPDRFINTVKKDIENSRTACGNRSDFLTILVNYRNFYGSKQTRQEPFSDAEIYWYSRQFVDDGKFFMYLGEIIREVLPNDETMTAHPVRKSAKYIKVKACVKDSGVIYTYKDAVNVQKSESWQ